MPELPQVNLVGDAKPAREGSSHTLLAETLRFCEGLANIRAGPGLGTGLPSKGGNS